MRYIRISVEIGSPNDADYEVPLPDDWDTWDETRQDQYLNDTAMDHLAYHASAGASVEDREED